MAILQTRDDETHHRRSRRQNLSAGCQPIGQSIEIGGDAPGSTINADRPCAFISRPHLAHAPL
jgi:hypothetical protein